MEKRDFDIICNSSVNWKMYENKTILVTGATGRLGRYILETLVDVDIKYNLNLRVIGLARSEAKIKEVFGDTMEFPNVSFINQDINEAIGHEGDIDYIFHTAGPAAPVDFKDTAVETLWAHVNGTHNVLECARRHNTKRVFYVSTVEIYGTFNKKNVISEDDMGKLQNLNYRACYPEAKRLCETMLASYKEEYGVDFCGVRFSHTLGPGIVLDDGRAFAEFIDCALKGNDIILHSDGSAMRTYTYVADGINAAFLIMDKGESCLYNVATDENLISVRDLANLIAGLSPSGNTKVVFSDEASKIPYLPFKLPIMDTSKVRKLGWKPQVDIEKMFRWTVEAF
jgi:nucleoside-diphosphate-sugar epimerase